MKERICVIVILYMSVVPCLHSIEVTIGDNISFRGDSVHITGKLYYSGTIYGSDLSETIGLFDSEFNTLKASSYYPGGSRIFRDSLTHKIPAGYTRAFIPGQMYIELCGNTICRSYDFQRGYWVSNETAYNGNETYEKDRIYDSEDRMMIPLFKWSFYLFAIFFLIIKIINCFAPKKEVELKSWQTISLILGLFLLFAFVDNKYIEWAFLLPLCAWGILWCISNFAKGHIRNCFRIASGIIPLVLLCYQFLYTQTNIRLSDGQELPINWRRGTDLIRRGTLRKLISKMISLESGELYLSKNELTECEYSILSGELMSWFTYFKPNAIKSNLSYDEANMFINELNDLIGYDYFCIPNAETWSMAVKETDLTTVKEPEDDPHGINNGILSTCGFVDLGGNLKELTSSKYYSSYANSNGIIFKFPDYLVIKGNSYYEGEYSFGDTRIPQNFFANNLGLRLAMNTTPKSDTCHIYGIITDTTDTKYPHKIELLEINGRKIKKTWDEMERELIELSATNRSYKVKSLSDGVQIIQLQQNQEPYIFTPVKLKGL